MFVDTLFEDSVKEDFMLEARMPPPPDLWLRVFDESWEVFSLSYVPVGAVGFLDGDSSNGWDVLGGLELFLLKSS